MMFSSSDNSKFVLSSPSLWVVFSLLAFPQSNRQTCLAFSLYIFKLSTCMSVFGTSRDLCICLSRMLAWCKMSGSFQVHSVVWVMLKQSLLSLAPMKYTYFGMTCSSLPLLTLWVYKARYSFSGVRVCWLVWRPGSRCWLLSGFWLLGLPSPHAWLEERKKKKT